MGKAPLEWSGDMSVGHDGVDEQHRRLIDLINRLVACSTRQAGRDATFAALDALTAYVDEHFAEEERQMLACGYPDHAAHKADHDTMRGTIRTLRASVRSAGDVFGATVAILPKWLERHLTTLDRDIAVFLAERRGAPRR
ncbi:MAG TPA: bacteriohemerythrin [Azospirillum sp.]